MSGWAWLCAALLAAASAGALAGAQDPPRFSEKVDVARILFDVRAIDRRGRPLLGLRPSDFDVKIDGRPARVESVQHVAAGRMAAPAGGIGVSGRVVQPGPRGRPVVFLFQKSLHRTRITGMMLMLREFRRSLDALSPDDPVAIFRFDSRLQLLLDFTQDRKAIRRAFEHDVLFAGRRDADASRSSILRAVMDQERDDPSYTIERSLLRIAEALAPVPGAKSVVVVGHGFGRVSNGGVALDSEYERARNALQRARASVFSLDVTDADYHSLEVGLQAIAEDTGGLYQRTHVFSRAALDRVLAALDGHYVLSVEKPPLGPGSYRLEIRLRGRDGVVLAPPTYVN